MYEFSCLLYGFSDRKLRLRPLLHHKKSLTYRLAARYPHIRSPAVSSLCKRRGCPVPDCSALGTGSSTCKCPSRCGENSKKRSGAGPVRVYGHISLRYGRTVSFRPLFSRLYPTESRDCAGAAVVNVTGHNREAERPPGGVGAEARRAPCVAERTRSHTDW